MSNEIPKALPIGPEDENKRIFAWDLMKHSNDVVVAFAKLMSPTSLTAIGVLLSLARFAELGTGDDGWKLLLVGVSCIAYLAAALLFSYVVRGRQINISPDDYDDVVEQFLSAARLRQRMTNVGLGVVAFATLCGLTVILVALRDRS
jgi:hypothetical protein